MDELAVRYETDSGEIEITKDDVKNVLCNDKNVTDKDIKLFLELCRAQKLNPFIREAYIVKYSNGQTTIQTGKDVFTKRASRNPKFRGFQAGITVVDANGSLCRREGSMELPGECLVGAWCDVYVDGYDHPMHEEVSYSEYVKINSKGQPNKQWAKMPATMLRKVALVHALREAFPEDLQGLYDESELGYDEQPGQAEIIDVAPKDSETIKMEDF